MDDGGSSDDAGRSRKLDESVELVVVAKTVFSVKNVSEVSEVADLIIGTGVCGA